MKHGATSFTVSVRPLYTALPQSLTGMQASFEAARAVPVHQKNPALTPVEILSGALQHPFACAPVPVLSNSALIGKSAAGALHTHPSASYHVAERASCPLL